MTSSTHFWHLAPEIGIGGEIPLGGPKRIRELVSRRGDGNDTQQWQLPRLAGASRIRGDGQAFRQENASMMTLRKAFIARRTARGRRCPRAARSVPETAEGRQVLRAPSPPCPASTICEFVVDHHELRTITVQEPQCVISTSVRSFCTLRCPRSWTNGAALHQHAAAHRRSASRHAPAGRARRRQDHRAGRADGACAPCTPSTRLITTRNSPPRRMP